jgi:hypothetical protein
MTVGSFVLGLISYKQFWRPQRVLDKVWTIVAEVVSPTILRLEASPVRNKTALQVYQPDAMQPGLLLLMMDLGDRENAVRVMDRSGRVIHEWKPLWLDLWPKGEGSFTDDERPIKGTLLHGLEILPDASIVSNFEYLSTFSLDVCGAVKWKHDNHGHHSVHRNDDGSFWVPAVNVIRKNPVGYPLHVAPFDSYLIQKIGADGRMLQSKPLTDILQENGLDGLMYLSAKDNYRPTVATDTMHLNDIEAFPSTMTSDVFSPGDLLLSIRNINTVMVVDPKTWKVKWKSTGHVLRQHDADFLPGDRISVFDNRNFDSAPEAGPAASRIVEFDVRSGAVKTILSGNGPVPFFTSTRGVHQRLANGNILVTSTGEGMVVEFTPDGQPVWRFEHRVEPNKNRIIYHARVLPPEMDEAFFRERAKTCRTARAA